VLKPLLLMGLGAFALVGLLMLGGWALTSATPDVPERQAPAAAGQAEPGSAARGRASGQSQQAGAGAQPVTREQKDAVRDGAAAPARDLARRARQRVPRSSAAGSAAASHSSEPTLPPLRRDQDQPAEARARADAAQQLAGRRRAERLRREEIARQADAAKRADEAAQATERAREQSGADDPPGGD
jgi:hypothetical protein